MHSGNRSPGPSTDLGVISLCHKPMESDQESASPKPDLWLQVFADNGSGYNETDSMLQQISGKKLSTVRFLHIEKLQRSGRSLLRIDPVNLPAILQIFKIRIVRDTDQALLYVAETKEDSESWFSPRAFFPTLTSLGCS